MPLLASSPLALPEQADLEGAWQENFDFATFAPGAIFSRPTPGETYEQLISAHFSLTTSAAAGNRTPLVVIQNANGNNVVVVSAAAAQGPSLTLGYSVDGSGKLQYSLPGGGGVIALPPQLLLPGTKIFITVQAMDPADFLSFMGLVYLRIPTKAPQRPTAPILSTPLQV